VGHPVLRGAPFPVRFFSAQGASQLHADGGGYGAFSKELEAYKTTKGMLQIRYDEPLPEALIRKMAEHRVRTVRERKDDAFW